MHSAKPACRFDILFHKDVLECTGSVDTLYSLLAGKVKEQLPACSAADFFFEQDEAALRLEMKQCCNVKCEGDRVGFKGCCCPFPVLLDSGGWQL